MAVVTQQFVDIPVGDLAMRTFVAAPRSPGSHPAIVFYSDIFQLTEPTLRWCVRLASYGFQVAAPEIYHRIEPSGTVLEFDDEGKARGQRDAETTPVAHFDADVAATLDWLEERTGGAPLVRLVTAPVDISPFARLSSSRTVDCMLVPHGPA
jgi:carboxymethylenebutenolidase